MPKKVQPAGDDWLLKVRTLKVNLQGQAVQGECQHLLDCCSLQLLECSTVVGLVQHAYTPVHLSEWRHIHTSVQWRWNQRQCPYSWSIQSAANRHPFYPWAFTVHSPHHYFKSRAVPIQHAGKHNWLLNNNFVELMVNYVFWIETCHVQIHALHVILVNNCV